MASPVSRRTDAQTSKRAAVEAALLEATEELLTEGASYAELNIEKIATRAGISRTAFYFYFRDKRELLLRLTEDVATILYAEAEGWWSGAGDGRSELRRAIESILGLYREHHALLRAVVEVATYDEPVAVFWRGLMGRFVTATQERIEAEQAAGRAAALPAAPTAFALVWMTERAYYQQVVQDEPLDEHELVRALVGIWTHAIYGAGA